MRLAIFDLDGTITRRDTLVPYLWSYARHHLHRLPRVAVVLPAALRLLADRDRGRFKGTLIHAVMGGATLAQVEAATQLFVPQLLRDGLHPDALRALQRHQAAGDRRILLSASTDLYVPRLGAALGFDQVICTAVRWHGKRLDGHLAGPNRRGEEKRRCVAELLAHWRPEYSTAYGNAASDLAHMRLTDEAFLVNGNAAARRQARSSIPPRTRMHCVDWS
jgi:HAD superfamily hydrolase (TIGR01490 family)